MKPNSFMDRVSRLMADGRWRTLKEIARHINCCETGASARLRDLRKPRYGGLKVDRRTGRDGVNRYRVANG